MNNCACSAKDSWTVHLASLTPAVDPRPVLATGTPVHPQHPTSSNTTPGGHTQAIWSLLDTLWAGAYCWHSVGRVGAQGLAMCTNIHLKKFPQVTQLLSVLLDTPVSNDLSLHLTPF